MRNPHIQAPAALSVPRTLPGWIASGPADSLEVAAFRAGAALACLTFATTAEDLPQALWRDRLALAAAEACMSHSGRREGAGALRDAVHMTKAGDDPGPAGRVFRQISQAVTRPISIANMARALEGVTPEQIELCLDAAGPTPVERAAQVIAAVLADNPRDETAALILADAVLAKALGWTHVVPLVSLALKARDLRESGDELRLACHLAVVVGVRQALSLAAELSRAAFRLRAVMPKLRAKAATRAVDLFLSRDALSPAALAWEMQSSLSDRAARRLCDRLVDLGAVRELTGRDSFRLYGI